jgi:ABC-2 type transport system permease protein
VAIKLTLARRFYYVAVVMIVDGRVHAAGAPAGADCALRCAEPRRTLSAPDGETMNLLTIFRALLAGALRDRTSAAAPLALLFGLGALFPDPEYRQLVWVGALAFGVLSFAMSGTGFQVMSQRTRGVYKLLCVSPFPTLTFIGAVVAARGLGTLASAAALIVAAVALGTAQLSVSSVLLAIPVLVLGVACFSALGVALGNLGNDEIQVAMVNNLFLLPRVFGAEMFYSLSGAPEWVRVLSRALPVSHFLDALRAAALGNPAAVIQRLFYLAISAILAIALAALTFRWDLDRSLFSKGALART